MGCRSVTEPTLTEHRLSKAWYQGHTVIFNANTGEGAVKPKNPQQAALWGQKYRKSYRNGELSV